MSKSQMKKLKKRQYYEEKKQKRKQAEKQQKQADLERRREAGRQRIAAMTEEEQKKWREERDARGLARKHERQEARARMEKALDIGQKIVIDLDFADLMTDTELRSICQQLGYCWHINCAAKHPAHLALTSLQGKMREVMGRQISGYLNWQATTTEKPYIEHFADCKDRLVYLTADSENELQELDPEAIYIVGGIVDRNRHKLLCYNKAEEQGIAHARLPIGEYVRLASSQVMTTNHIIHILLHWLELRDWKAAFEAVIPNRKRKGGEDEEAGQLEEQQEGQEAGDEGHGDAAQQVPAKRQDRGEGEQPAAWEAALGGQSGKKAGEEQQQPQAQAETGEERAH